MDAEGPGAHAEAVIGLVQLAGMFLTWAAASGKTTELDLLQQAARVIRG